VGHGGKRMIPPPQARAHLYTHEKHPHTPRNPNARHAQEHAAAGLNATIAIWLTKHVGTMACAYVFAGIGIGSLVGVFTGSVFLAALFGSVSSYFLQLVLLPVLSVGQNVLSRHSELMAEEMYHNTLRLLHENAEAAKHLAAQDAELLKQTALLVQLHAEQGTGKDVAKDEPAPASGIRLRVDPSKVRVIKAKTT
jgi:hypothetical protein